MSNLASRGPNSALLRVTQIPQDTTRRLRQRRLLPFYLIEGAAVCSDAILILTTSTLTGIAYHLALFGHAGSVGTFFGIGILTFVNFSAILMARTAYRPQHLANFWRQARDTTAVWLLVFFVLAAVAFSLKVSETYSRGATLTFFVAGWSAIILWRFVLAHLISRALATGAFAQRKTILLCEKGQLTGSRVVDELKRCGYLPVRTFEFARYAIPQAMASSWFSNLLDEVVEINRQEHLECVFLLASWEDRRSIERLSEVLRNLSVPVYLLPDRNVAHFLGSRTRPNRNRLDG